MIPPIAMKAIAISASIRQFGALPMEFIFCTKPIPEIIPTANPIVNNNIPMPVSILSMSRYFCSKKF